MVVPPYGMEKTEPANVLLRVFTLSYAMQQTGHMPQQKSSFFTNEDIVLEKFIILSELILGTRFGFQRV